MHDEAIAEAAKAMTNVPFPSKSACTRARRTVAAFLRTIATIHDVQQVGVAFEERSVLPDCYRELADELERQNFSDPADKAWREGKQHP